jgi:hypothetical protein
MSADVRGRAYGTGSHDAREGFLLESEDGMTNIKGIMELAVAGDE